MIQLSGDFTKMVRDGNVANKPPRKDRAVPSQRRGATAYGGPGVASACGLRSIDGAQIYDAAYPYWRMMFYGSEPTYRLMLQQDTIALARYVVTGPVRASAWDMTWSDGVEKSRQKQKVDDGDPAIRYVKDHILPLRRKVIRDAIRCVDYGWQPFVVTWSIIDGMYVPDVSPVLPDTTTVLRDGSIFAGIENIGEDGKKLTFNNLESWAPALDAEAGYAYGRSRLENLRTTAWGPWLTTVLRMAELERKLTGIIPIVSHAPNGYIDDDGNAVNYRTGAQTVLESLPRGEGVMLESLFDPREIIDKAPELADKLSKLKVINVDFFDAGSVSPAVVGLLALLEYWDKKLFRGMLRPERSGLEAVAAGSRADSEQHTETGAADSEAIDADLTESFDENVARTALRLNFGEDKARRIHVISTPLLKWKQQIFREMLTRAMSIPDIAISIVRSLDMDSVFAQMSLPQIKAFIMETIESGVKPPADSGVKPDKNGKPTAEQVNRVAALLYSEFGKH